MTGIRSDQTLVRLSSKHQMLFMDIYVHSTTASASSLQLYYHSCLGSCAILSLLPAEAAAPDILIRFCFHCSLLHAAALSVILTRIKRYPAGSVLKH